MHNYKAYPLGWKTKIRPKILLRDGYKCGWCESTQQLSVAHLDQNPGNNEESNLATACLVCHAKFDGSFLKAKLLKKLEDAGQMKLPFE